MWTEAARERYRDDGRRTPSDLTDAEWQTIEPVPRGYATLTVDLREMLNACLHLEKTGCPWRYLPPLAFHALRARNLGQLRPREFGPWQSVRSWHDRFRANGLWSDIATLLIRAVRAQQGRAAEPTTAILDSQSVTSGPQKRPRGVDGNKKVRGIKRLVLTCSLGFVLATLVTTANAHDTQPVGALLDRAAEEAGASSAPRWTASMSVRAWRRQPRNTIWTSRSRRARRDCVAWTGGWAWSTNLWRLS